MNVEEPHYDFYSLLENNIFPERILVRSRLDDLILYTLLPILANHPEFKAWLTEMKSIDEPALLLNDEVPVIRTNYHLTRTEVHVITPKLVNSFMSELANGVKRQQIPLVEAFSVLLDAVYSFQYQATNKLSNIH